MVRGFGVLVSRSRAVATSLSLARVPSRLFCQDSKAEPSIQNTCVPKGLLPLARSIIASGFLSARYSCAYELFGNRNVLTNG